MKLNRNYSLNTYKALLVIFVTSLTITGIGFIDEIIWNVNLAIIGAIAYAIVGLLFSIGLLHGKNLGKNAYAAVFILLFALVCGVYNAIVAFQNWMFNLPLAIKVLIPSVIVLFIIVVVILVIRHKNQCNQSDQIKES